MTFVPTALVLALLAAVAVAQLGGSCVCNQCASPCNTSNTICTYAKSCGSDVGYGLRPTCTYQTTCMSDTDCLALCAYYNCADFGYSCAKCFPADATVTLEDGTTKTMAQLTIGDSVLVAPNTFSKVYMFSHKLEATKAAFVAIVAGETKLRLSADHYLYVNGKLAVAGTVRVGDSVTLADGTSAAVTAVSTEWSSGLYNPHTLHGDIVVNGVQTSTYTQGIAPALAHAALWPVRALFQAGVNVSDSTFAAGSDVITQLLPNGQTEY